MENRKLPALIALVGVVIAIVVFFFVAGDDTADEATETTSSEQTEKPDGSEGPEVPVIEIVEGQPVEGVAELEVTKGEEINFIVESDAAHEVHLHTYDVTMDVPAGGKVEFSVPASIGGVIEAELEDVAVPIAEISVVPG
ncbi:MAG: hypothetical protein M3355_08320 [Actinomycetota bacterium]|nr:hypothetical protein [Actinomycetota bacterium]